MQFDNSVYEDFDRIAMRADEMGDAAGYGGDPRPGVEAAVAYAVEALRNAGFVVAKPLDPVIDTVLNDDPEAFGGCTDDYVAVAYFKESDVR